MKNIIIIGIIGIVVIGGGFFITKGDKAQVAENVSLPETQAQQKIAVNAADAPSFDISLCSLQTNGNYICPANAISNFGPYTLETTGGNNTCTISYDSTTGFSFIGTTKTGTVSNGDLAVSVTPSNGLANVARSAGQSLSFHVGEGDQIDHILFVDTDYTSEQCLVIR